MSEWWTYRLSDFLLFAPHTYYRLVERYNADVWPAQLVALAIGIAIVVLLRRPTDRHMRLIAALVALCWAWVAWAFHLERYATINWAATYFAAAFAVEAALLLWVAAVRDPVAAEPGQRLRRIGIVLVAVALLLLPPLGFVEGRTWRQLEIFAMSPDATAIATLGILMQQRAGRRSWLLWPIPLAWCAVGAAIAWATGSPMAVALPFFALLAMILTLVDAKSRRSAPTKARGAASKPR